MKNQKIIFAALFLGLFNSPVSAERVQFQLGYVFDSWTNNFISSGQEHRMPASLSFTSGDLNLSGETAFVIGDYEQMATSTSGASSYQPSQFSDSSVSASVDLHLGPSLLSTLAGSLNIGSGDTNWESRSSNGAIPFLFEPSFYHGRGWGGSFFWSLASTEQAFQWGAGAGYLLTTTYAIGLAGDSTFNPGDSLLVMGSMGGSLSRDEKIGVQAFHTFAFESKVADPLAQFTSAESTVVCGQWLKKMGGDKLALNLSYSFYGRALVADPTTGQQVSEDENFLGDKLEVRPFFGYQTGPGVSFQTGLIWDRVFPNGYPQSDSLHFQAGGDLLGLEQSATFQMGSGAFLNLAGLYHFINDQKAAVDAVTGSLYDVTYSRISFGTNVGFQW